MNKLAKIGVLTIFLLPFLAKAQQHKVALNKEIVNSSKEIMLADSLEFISYVDSLLHANGPDRIEYWEGSLQEVKYRRWLRPYSHKIVSKLGDLYKSRSTFDDLYSLLTIPDSIRKTIFCRKDPIDLAKARLGDSASIAKYYNYYKMECSKTGRDYDGKMVAYYINFLLDFNDPILIQKLFKDMGKDTIIVSINRSDEELIYSTMGYAFIVALRHRYFYEPIFNKRYMGQYFDAKDFSLVNKHIKKYYRQVEAFVKEKYGIKVKINTPYLLVGWPDYGFY